MTNYWIIQPFETRYPAVFKRAWEYDRRNNTIAIGRHEVGDIAGLGRAELEDRVRAKSAPERWGGVQDLWDIHRIDPGDVVMAKRGTMYCIGIGVVTRAAYFDWNRDDCEARSTLI